MTKLADGKLRRMLQGIVVAKKMNKTATVLIERKVTHPSIGKIVKKSKKYHAHNESLVINMGDLVQIEETSPRSKTKTWRVVAKVVEAGEKIG